jgi:hypothetical protein
MKPSTTITAVFLLIVSIGHLLRLIFQVKVMANSVELPMWASIPICVITIGLAVWLFLENKK